MDPNQTWRDLSNAIADDDWPRAGQHADDLLEWLSHGGFPPKVTGSEPFDRIVAIAACEAIAAWEVA